MKINCKYSDKFKVTPISKIKSGDIVVVVNSTGCEIKPTITGKVKYTTKDSIDIVKKDGKRYKAEYVSVLSDDLIYKVVFNDSNENLEKWAHKVLAKREANTNYYLITTTKIKKSVINNTAPRKKAAESGYLVSAFKTVSKEEVLRAVNNIYSDAVDIMPVSKTIFMGLADEFPERTYGYDDFIDMDENYSEYSKDSDKKDIEERTEEKEPKVIEKTEKDIDFVKENEGKLFDVYFKKWDMPLDKILSKLDEKGISYFTGETLGNTKIYMRDLTPEQVDIVRGISDENGSILHVNDAGFFDEYDYNEKTVDDGIGKDNTEIEVIKSEEPKYKLYQILTNNDEEHEKMSINRDGKRSFYVVKKISKDKIYNPSKNAYEEVNKYWVDGMVGELGGNWTGSFNVYEDTTIPYSPTKKELEKLIERYIDLHNSVYSTSSSREEYLNIQEGLKQNYADILNTFDESKDYFGEIKKAFDEKEGFEPRDTGTEEIVKWSKSYDYKGCNIHLMFGDGTNKIEKGILKVDITKNYGAGEYAKHRGFEIDVTEDDFSVNFVVEKTIELCAEINVELDEIYKKQFDFYKGLLLGFLKEEKPSKHVISSNINELARLCTYAPEYYPQYMLLMLEVPKRFRPTINPYDISDGNGEFVKYLQAKDKSVFEFLPVKNYDLPKYKPFDIDPNDKTFMSIHKEFVSLEEIRFNLNGTNFNEFGAVSVDAHILLFTPYREGENKFEGNFCYTKQCVDNEASVKAAGFPAWQAVIPKNNLKSNVNAHALFNFLKNAIKLEMTFGGGEAIGLKFDNSEDFFFVNAQRLLTCVESMIKLGHNSIEMNYSTPNRAILLYPTGQSAKILSNKTDFALVMPVMQTDPSVIANFNAETSCVFYQGEKAEYCFDLVKVESVMKAIKEAEEKSALLAEIQAMKDREMEKEAAAKAAEEKRKADEEAAKKAEQERIAAEKAAAERAKLENEKMSSIAERARKIKSKKEAKEEIKKAENLTIEELEATIEGAEITLEDLEGEEKKSMQDYIDGLKVVLFFKKKDSKNISKEEILEQFNELTKDNDHTEAAILLAENFGTDEEVSKLKKIQKDQEKRGYITQDEQAERDEISNKYYYKLKNDKFEKGGDIEDEVVLEAKTKGGKYVIKISKDENGRYSKSEFTNGSQRASASYKSKEDMELDLNYNMDGALKIDGHNFIVTKNTDNINVLEVNKSEPLLSRMEVKKRLGYELNASEVAMQSGMEIAQIAFNNGIKASSMSFEEFTNKVFEKTNTSYAKAYLEIAYNLMKARGYAKGGNISKEYLLWGVKIGEPDYFETIIFVDSEPIKITEGIKKLALSKGYDRLRVSESDLSTAPDFAGTVKYENGGEISKEQYISLLKEYDLTGALLEDTEDTGDLEERARLKAKLRELESKIHRYERSYAEGGDVNENRHTYMMLGRLQSDNDYYLGYGNRSEKRLWAGNVDDQIKEMKKLWNQLPEDGKPEWLSMEDILEYERKMKNEHPNSGVEGFEDLYGEEVVKIYNEQKNK